MLCIRCVVLLSDCKGTHFLCNGQIFRCFFAREKFGWSVGTSICSCRRRPDKFCAKPIDVMAVELCNDARNIRRTGAVFQKNILNLRKILARTKPTQVGEVGTGLFDIAARVPCKNWYSYSERLLTLVLDGKKLRTFLYRSQGQGSNKTPVVCIYHV